MTVPQLVGGERVFLLGGAEDEHGTRTLKDCFEVNLSKKKPELVPIAKLLSANIGFGACVSSDGTKIYIAGGTQGENKKTTNESYVYDIELDTWT